MLLVASLVRLCFNFFSSFSFVDIFLNVLSNCSPRCKYGFTLVPRYLYDFVTCIGVELWNNWIWLQTLESFQDVLNSIHSVLTAFKFNINSLSVKNLDTLFTSLFNIDCKDWTSLTETNITASSANWITSLYLRIPEKSLKYIKYKVGSQLNLVVRHNKLDINLKLLH